MEKREQIIDLLNKCIIGESVANTADRISDLFSVGTHLFGVYSPEEDLLAVHATEQGAEENKANYEKHHGEGFHVDYVMLQP